MCVDPRFSRFHRKPRMTVCGNFSKLRLFAHTIPIIGISGIASDTSHDSSFRDTRRSPGRFVDTRRDSLSAPKRRSFFSRLSHDPPGSRGSRGEARGRCGRVQTPRHDILTRTSRFDAFRASRPSHPRRARPPTRRAPRDFPGRHARPRQRPRQRVPRRGDAQIRLRGQRARRRRSLQISPRRDRLRLDLFQSRDAQLYLRRFHGVERALQHRRRAKERIRPQMFLPRAVREERGDDRPRASRRGGRGGRRHLGGGARGRGGVRPRRREFSSRRAERRRRVEKPGGPRRGVPAPGPRRRERRGSVPSRHTAPDLARGVFRGESFDRRRRRPGPSRPSPASATAPPPPPRPPRRRPRGVPTPPRPSRPPRARVRRRRARAPQPRPRGRPIA